MSLTFGRLAKTNWTRCVKWHSPQGWSVAEWTNAMAGEAGEACNISKKLLRLAHRIEKRNPELGESELIGRLGEELADVVIYADLCAQRVGLDLGHEIVKKFNATSREFNFKEIL